MTALDDTARAIHAWVQAEEEPNEILSWDGLGKDGQAAAHRMAAAALRAYLSSEPSAREIEEAAFECGKIRARGNAWPEELTRAEWNDMYSAWQCSVNKEALAFVDNCVDYARASIVAGRRAALAEIEERMRK